MALHLLRQGYFVHQLREPNMNTFFTAVRQFVRDERGVTAIEYGLIAALMAAAVAAAVGGVGTAISNKFTQIATSITSA
jgi:pilus assembly protein Flp/PilA